MNGMITCKKFLIPLFLAVSVETTIAAPRQFRVHTLMEKTNATLTVFHGAGGALYGGAEVNTIIGETKEFGPDAVTAFVVLGDAASKDQVKSLLLFQGRITSEVFCNRIRMGNSPDAPQIKVAVLAEGCTIKSISTEKDPSHS
jgi:hypothetical protein